MADLQLETSWVLFVHHGCSFHNECCFVATEKLGLSQFRLGASIAVTLVSIPFVIEQPRFRVRLELR